MKDEFRVMDSDLHVIEDAAVYENHFTGPHRDAMPRYLGWSPTNFPHWDVQGTLIPPWALDEAVAGPQRALDAPSEDIYRPIRAQGYDPASTLEAMAVEGIDGCWIGPGDLRLSMGVDLSTPEGREAHRSTILGVFEACRKVGKIPGLWTPDASAALDWIQEGALFVTAGGDSTWMLEGAREALRQLGRSD